MNRLDLSDDGRFVQWWHNGAVVKHFPVTGFLADVVGLARDQARRGTGQEPEISKALKQRLDAADAALIRMACGKTCE